MQDYKPFRILVTDRPLIPEYRVSLCYLLPAVKYDSQNVVKKKKRRSNDRKSLNGFFYVHEEKGLAGMGLHCWLSNCMAWSV